MVGNRRRVKFWKDLWYEKLTLKEAFSNLFHLAFNKNGWVSEAWEEDEDLASWSPRFSIRLGVGESGGFVSQTTILGCEKKSRGRYELERVSTTNSLLSPFITSTQGLLENVSHGVSIGSLGPVRVSFFLLEAEF